MQLHHGAQRGKAKYKQNLSSVYPTDISQYRLRFGFSLLYKTVFHFNCLTAQLSYEGRSAVKGAISISKFAHHNINGGAVDDT
jgi:hypothetical protein